MKTHPLVCHIRALANATRIDVYDEIGGSGEGILQGISAKDFAAQLADVKGPLDVHINSYGGSVKDGIAITNAIRGHNGPKRTIVDGMACSAASVIMQAGDERIVQPGAMVMIHDASAGVYGNPAQVKQAADELEKFSDNLAQVYASRAGGTPEKWRAAMRDETWYTADEAVAAGLADKVGDGAAALPGELDLSVFASVPDNVMARLQTLPVREVLAAYQPQPYKREAWENVLCPVCGCYNDDDGKYCGQCGVMLAGRDDVTSERAPGGGDGMTDKAVGGPVAAGSIALVGEDGCVFVPPAASGTDWLRRQVAADRARSDGEEITVQLTGEHGSEFATAFMDLVRDGKIRINAAEIDQSDWDGPKAMSMAAKSDDPAATYKQICAGRRDGDPSKQDSWALPYRYPGKRPNAAGVRNALSRLPQTEGLTNEAAARALLERLMKQINPDYDGDDANNAAPSWITNQTAAPPAWFTQTQPAAPAWLNLAKEANK